MIHALTAPAVRLRGVPHGTVVRVSTQATAEEQRSHATCEHEWRALLAPVLVVVGGLPTNIPADAQCAACGTLRAPRSI